MRKGYLGALTIGLFLSIQGAASGGAVRYVDNHSVGGPTWTIHFSTIQAAINSSGPGDQVWVKRGDYEENLVFDGNPGKHGNGVAIYGGFKGNETTLSDRVWDSFASSARKTTVKGRMLTSVVSIVDCDNSLTRVDGFVLTEGNGTMETTGSHGISLGGGAYVLRSGPIIQNNIIRGNIVNNNWANIGGGIALQYGLDSALISHNVIASNTAETYGGGVFVAHGDTNHPVVEGNIIQSNYSCWGGGVHVGGTSAEVRNNLIKNNSGGQGAGVWLTGLGSPTAQAPRVVNNTFVGNLGGWTVEIANFDASSSPIVANNIVFGNTLGISYDNYNAFCSEVIVSNDSYNNDINFNAPLDYPFDSSNFSDPPGFVGASDFHLIVGSLCIDRGETSLASPTDLDLDRNDRIVNTVVDIGCYEFAP